MRWPFGISVEVKRTVQDRFGDRTETTAATIGPCVYSPSAGATGSWKSVENQDQQTQTIQTGTLFVPPDADVQSTDILMIDGQRWHVDGVPAVYVSPFDGWNPGMPVPIKRVVG